MASFTAIPLLSREIKENEHIMKVLCSLKSFSKPRYLSDTNAVILPISSFLVFCKARYTISFRLA